MCAGLSWFYLFSAVIPIASFAGQHELLRAASRSITRCSQPRSATPSQEQLALQLSMGEKARSCRAAPLQQLSFSRITATGLHPPGGTRGLAQSWGATGCRHLQQDPFAAEVDACFFGEAGGQPKLSAAQVFSSSFSSVFASRASPLLLLRCCACSANTSQAPKASALRGRARYPAQKELVQRGGRAGAGGPKSSLATKKVGGKRSWM